MLLLLLGFLALLGIVVVANQLAERAEFLLQEVVAARDARIAAVELRNSLQTAESSQRGFLYMGREIYLAPYGTAKTLAQRQLGAVRQLMQLDADAQLDRLEQVVAGKLADADQTIELKRERRDEEALALFRTNRGKMLMDEANLFLSGLISRADERLTASSAEQHANARWLRFVTVFGGLVIIAMTAGAAAVAWRYTQELTAARDAFRSLNEGLEQRVEERTADLVAANEEIQRFAHIVSHDLRAPLVNIVGFTDEIEAGLSSISNELAVAPAGNQAASGSARDLMEKELPEAIGFIRASTTKMDRLIAAILKLSREGRREMVPETLNLHELVGRALAAIQFEIEKAGAEVEVSLEAPTLVSDRLALDQILGNLLDNALKYRSKERPLRIEVRSRALTADRIDIEVADTGRGIAREDFGRVFELFRRAGPQDQPGEGMGLAYVRALVHRLDGSISVSSELGKGTTFHLVLPAVLVPQRMEPAAIRS